MAGKERGAFRPLGLRMQDFGRRLMRHYVSPQSTPPPQNFVPAPGWQADTQTPLIWDDPQPDYQPVENPPVEMDIPPAAEPLPAPRPVRRAAPTSAPTVRRKADSEEKIDPRLLAILAAHQERETRVAEIRERKTASDLQRQATEGETDLPTSRRRNRASFDYVQTKALLPPEDEMGHTAPPKTPPSDVIQTARESDQPDDDDSEESSQARIVDFDASQPIDQASPAAPPALVQRMAEIAPEPEDLPLEELPQFSDDEPETEPVYPLVYGLPEFPRVAEEPELFGEREITPPPSEPGKPDAPISPSTSPAASLQREADVTPIQYAADVPDAEPGFFPPVHELSETDTPPPNVQRTIETPPTHVRREIESPSPPRVQRGEKPSTKSPASPQPQVNQPPSKPTADIPVWQGDSAETEWFPPISEIDDEVIDAEPAVESADALPPAQPIAQREMGLFAEASAESDSESADVFSPVQPSIQRKIEPEAYEESMPTVFDQPESAQPSTSSEQPVVQRKAPSPPDSSPVQPHMGQGDAASDLYFDAASYDQYTDTEPIENAFIQREFEDVQPTIDEDYWTDSEAEVAPDELVSQAPVRPVDHMPPVSSEPPRSPERPVVQRKTESPPSTPPVQPDSGQGDKSADASFEAVSYSENVDMPSVENAFIQREFEDVQPTIDEGYWTDSEAEAAPDELVSQAPTHFVDYTPPVSIETPPPSSERSVVQRKAKAPPATTPVQPDQEQGDESLDFAFENLISDNIPVAYPDAPGQIEAPFADDWENTGDDLPFESAADITPDAPHSQLMSSPPNQIARQPDFSQDIEQPEPFYDAPSGEAEQPVDVFQALVGAGMISPPDHSPRIDRQALPPEENDYIPDEENFSEESYSQEQPVDLYQAMLNSGMVAPPAGHIASGHEGKIARKPEPDQASGSDSAAPERLPIQYAAETPRVMRVETETNTSESSSTGEKSGDVDIDKLARDVYSALRSRLRIEKERRG